MRGRRLISLARAGDGRRTGKGTAGGAPPGLWSGRSVLPNRTALSTCSYGLDELHIHRLAAALAGRAIALGLHDGKVVHLDFHSLPHSGDEPEFPWSVRAARERAPG
ncbi:MAG: hypothetical protein JW751_24605 [Polyangiaceae bacterium]|nr:hypothetical protein [Polyangiaceae bacterium]